jgi:hypothetical protein
VILVCYESKGRQENRLEFSGEVLQVLFCREMIWAPGSDFIRVVDYSKVKYDAMIEPAFK